MATKAIHTETLAALEWSRFLKLAREEARTEPGKALMDAALDPARWARDVSTAKVHQLETQETVSLLDREGFWGPLVDLPDPAVPLEALIRGSVLETVDLAGIRRWLYAVDTWAQTPREEIRGERFRKAMTSLPDPHEPLRILDRVLTPEGELSEKASPKLGSLSSEIRSLKREIGIVLDHLLKTFAQKGVLQENFSDVRDGRYVIPVKISNQNDVDGIIYEASASRQTVFVEPKEVGGLNNRLRQRQNEYIQEVYRVLQETSEKLKPFAGEIQFAVATLAHWDSVQARARFGRHYSGKLIEVTEERQFWLRQSAHPLLFWSLAAGDIIRNEVDFGEPIRTLLITGPNTGGKTVLLKMLGLAAICARTGFPFPGSEQPQVPFIDTIFADLGDPQSIEQHLSSFSGHVLRFKEILERVTDRSLVLIDELNTATDPEEGAALGRAVLETVMGCGAIVVATTHDPHLKALSVSDERILNASMAFDEAARTPTYRMLLGVPGRSRALETAERLGLPAKVLELARKYLTREHNEFERMLAKLESDVAETARARKEAVTIREEAEKLKKEWTERTGAVVNEMLDRTRQKLRRVLEQAQDEVRTSVRKLDELRNRRDVDQARSGLSETFARSARQIEQALSEEAPGLADSLEATLKPVELPEAEEIKITAGMTVRVPRWKTTGTVLEVSGNKIKVAMGTLQMQMSITDVEPLAAKDQQQLQIQKQRQQARIVDADRPASPGPSIDLRGVRFEEAMMRLQAYLDQAVRSGSHREVTVIHGLGTGAIREGARKLLGELPYVKEYRDGGVGMGGAGATIVEFE